ncbi:glycosyl hydrolases family 16-domain-containing protein [Blakeslea trispora]|nr:glycosyl hydrolases family 16-domain-containing protein [Blakeslea trispora]
MKLLEPEGNKRLNVAEGDRTLPVNSKEGSGFTFNHTNTMLYGEFTVDLKSAEAPGAVTAIILYANNGDEIDFEILAGAKDQVTTNYFYGQNITYGVNGETTDVEGKQAYAKFHKYTIKWTPEKIIWSIDGAVVRQKLKSSTVLDPKHGNINQYPGSLAYISIGLWDGSTSPGTAEWSQGPIDWKKYPGAITAHVRSVEVICDPKHN